MEKRIFRCQLGFDSNYKTWHTNDANMVIYMHSDGGSIVCSERIYPIKKGVLCFIGAKKYHYTMPSNAGVYERSKIFISSEEFNRLISTFQKEDAITKCFNENSIVYAQISEADIETVDALFDDILNYAENESHGDTIFASSLLRMLVFMSENVVDTVAPPHGSMYKAVEYINAHIKDDITVDSICKHTHMSKYHFCRSFKKTTGHTVMNYILNTRITLAKNLLANESISVGEISGLCGFSNISVFCRAFKENTGMTPLQYRKKQNR